MPCLQGATWDQELTGAVGRIIGMEAAANGVTAQAIRQLLVMSM